jgi:hypothetical protein
MAPDNPPAGPEITHIEIRRVQNGFVIAGINMKVFESHRFAGEHPQRATFIARDVEEISNLITWIVAGSEMKWLPTVDLPVFDMEIRHNMSRSNQAQAPIDPPINLNINGVAP